MLSETSRLGIALTSLQDRPGSLVLMCRFFVMDDFMSLDSAISLRAATEELFQEGDWLALPPMLFQCKIERIYQKTLLARDG